MGGSGNGSAASEARSGRRGGSCGAKDFRPSSAGAVEKKDLTSGVHASARGEREGADDRRRESKKKAYFCKYANACAGGPAGPSGLAVWAGESWAGRQAGWAEGRVGRMVGRAESEEERFLN
jgi:hypothetical protein